MPPPRQHDARYHPRTASVGVPTDFTGEVRYGSTAQVVRGVLAFLRGPAPRSRQPLATFSGHVARARRARGHGDALALVGARGPARGLRAGLGRSLLLREEQARDVSPPLLVAARRLAHVRAVMARPDGAGAGARARALPARGLSHGAPHERGGRGAAALELPRLADRGRRRVARAAGEAVACEVFRGRGR